MPIVTDISHERIVYHHQSRYNFLNAGPAVKINYAIQHGYVEMCFEGALFRSEIQSEGRIEL